MIRAKEFETIAMWKLVTCAALIHASLKPVTNLGSRYGYVDIAND